MENHLPPPPPPPPRKLKLRQILAFEDFSVLTCGESPPANSAPRRYVETNICIPRRYCLVVYAPHLGPLNIKTIAIKSPKNPQRITVSSFLPQDSWVHSFHCQMQLFPELACKNKLCFKLLETNSLTLKQEF